MAELEKLGMLWSKQETAWADEVAVAKEYADIHACFLPPTTAVWDGYPIGVRAKNAHAAARKAPENEELRAPGRPVPSAVGAMTEARWDKLDTIDPGWCPAWDTGGTGYRPGSDTPGSVRPRNASRRVDKRSKLLVDR
ncbi:hypothetical protein [Streptomyces sp. NPDC056323]|uniref:hypothetical protein n=1 Tax=Streptomyces sp. NPDC056323 TaxID=3345784 RepID=UPI0035DFFE94